MEEIDIKASEEQHSASSTVRMAYVGKFTTR